MTDRGDDPIEWTSTELAMTAERLVDVWAADMARRARHHAAVIAAAHRAVTVVLDTDPTPPHGIARPMLRRVDGGRS